jgi:hypothetical protein
MADETAAQRFDRDYAQAALLDEDRRERELDNQSLARLVRLYVAPDGSTPADDNHVGPA